MAESGFMHPTFNRRESNVGSNPTEPIMGWKMSKHPTEKSPEWHCGCGASGEGTETFSLHKQACLLYLEMDDAEHTPESGCNKVR